MFKKVLILSALLGTLLVAQASTLNASSPTTTQSEQAKHSATGRVLDKSGAPIAYANVSVRKASGEVVAKVISYVTSDVRKPFSLDAAAKRCGYSKNHIISIFKKETGKTPYAYVLDMKIDMAKQLLLNSESSLASIGIECGFGSYLNFYRAFVNTVGVSPEVWRKERS